MTREQEEELRQLHGTLLQAARQACNVLAIVEGELEEAAEQARQSLSSAIDARQAFFARLVDEGLLRHMQSKS